MYIFQTSVDIVNDADCDPDSRSNDIDEYILVNSPIVFFMDDNGKTVDDSSNGLYVPYLPLILFLNFRSFYNNIVA